MKIKYMAILLILLCFLIGAASAADDGTVDSLDAAQDDAISIDAVEESDEVASTEPTSTQTDEKLEQSNDETKTIGATNFDELTSDDLIIEGNCTFENTTISTQKENHGNLTVVNSTINAKIVNNGNLTIKNSTINSEISNNGKLILYDDVIFGASFRISGNGEIVINDMNKLLPYLTTFNGDYIFENLTSFDSKTNNGNLILINSKIKDIINNGNLTLINSTLLGNNCKNYGNLTVIDSKITAKMRNDGLLILKGNLTFGKNNKLGITGTGNVIADNYTEVFPYLYQFSKE